jgi:protein-S-isoprenylcysteine O-methyltransferase Ste14
MIAGIYATIPAFWMLVHPFAEHWRRKGYGVKWLGPWWVLLWIIAWACEYPFRNSVLYEHAWAWLISAAPWTISAYAYSSSAKTFTLGRIIGRHEIDANKPQELITSGIYSRVRNPLYSAHLCTVLGWAIGTGSTPAFACAAFYLVTLMIMLPREEQELRARFGDAYRDYEQRVPRLIPRFF